MPTQKPLELSRRAFLALSSVLAARHTQGATADLQIHYPNQPPYEALRPLITPGSDSFAIPQITHHPARSMATPWFENQTSRLRHIPQLFEGAVPQWRASMDPACGIDIYGQQGIAVGDINSDGRDEIHVCQPGGLPNKLLQIGNDGVIHDISTASGLNLLDDTSSALFVDFRNMGLQDLVVLTRTQPLLFLNSGNGIFQLQQDAFEFANPPGGSFTSIAAADYDGDGRVDLYLCCYIYFQSEDQYSYPLPYHDSRNGPGNYLFQNEPLSDNKIRFRDVTAETGMNENNDRYSFSAAWCDYDFDGRQELYVANDFGRNNLYKFDGSRFRDIAATAGVEDLGPGMSAAWFDYDGDGRPDLYVTNMWTGVGQEIIKDPAFDPVARDSLQDAYIRHTRGNTLYRNLGDGRFEETPLAKQGYWAWAGDGFDFDADGLPEIIVTAGMITNDRPSETGTVDLESFFWRQVVSHSSPDGKAAPSYEEGWNALNQFVREDHSWNGDQPTSFFVQEDKEYLPFANALGAVDGIDTRAFAVTDMNGDGCLDVLLKARMRPQLQILANRHPHRDKHNCLVLQLQGTQSNRDAIGSWVTATTVGHTTSAGVLAGSAYLSQHTKKIHLGLGTSLKAEQVLVRWPSGHTEVLEDLAANHTYQVIEGQGIVSRQPLNNSPVAARTNSLPLAQHRQPLRSNTWLLDPLPLPGVHSNGPAILLLSESEIESPSRQVQVVNLSAAPESLAATYAIFQRYLFDYRGPFELPMALLFDKRSYVHKVYFTIPTDKQVQQDIQLLHSRDRQTVALPWQGWYHKQPARNFYRHGAAFLQAGFAEQGLPYLNEVLHRNGNNFKAQLAVGQIHLEAGRLEQSEFHLGKALQLNPDSPETWNNLGGLSMARKNYQKASDQFEKALSLRPGMQSALVNAGQAYASLGLNSQAEQKLKQALDSNPADADAANHLGLLLARQGRNPEAKQWLLKAIETRLDHSAAINNLAVLYIQSGEPAEAVSVLQYGIRTVPDNETMALNLARIHIQQGRPQSARSVLERLLENKPDSTVAHRALQELNSRP